jgi:hypothetical protein
MQETPNCRLIGTLKAKPLPGLITAGALADGWLEAREWPRCRAKDPRGSNRFHLFWFPLQRRLKPGRKRVMSRRSIVSLAATVIIGSACIVTISKSLG